MTPTLADTAVLIDLLRGSEPAARWLAALEEPPVASEVTRVEILRGMRPAERRLTETLIGTIAWLGVDESIGRRAGELGREYRRSHPGIGVADLIVAATAEHWSAELATTNLKHFPMFEDLRAPYEG